MTFSLNEVEAMGKRAARGAGLDWGIAEEAGKAARWLTAHGLPGPELLAQLLTRNEGKSYDELAPVSTDDVWQAESGCLCPLIAGAALSDRAAEGVAEGVAEGGIRADRVPASACPLCGERCPVAWRDDHARLARRDTDDFARRRARGRGRYGRRNGPNRRKRALPPGS
ncbi:MAG: DUF3726 domain-containing protein [Planctomycetota bacterium]|jgi:hypothetical protein